MRSLEKNKRTVWVVEPTGEKIPVLDRHGFPTGEHEYEYTQPKQIRIQLYPATGDIVNRMFGKDMVLKFVSSCDHKVMSEKALIFYDEPIGGYEEYDLSVEQVLESQNQVNYGLVNR